MPKSHKTGGKQRKTLRRARAGSALIPRCRGAACASEWAAVQSRFESSGDVPRQPASSLPQVRFAARVHARLFKTLAFVFDSMRARVCGGGQGSTQTATHKRQHMFNGNGGSTAGKTRVGRPTCDAAPGPQESHRVPARRPGRPSRRHRPRPSPASAATRRSIPARPVRLSPAKAVETPEAGAAVRASPTHCRTACPCSRPTGAAGDTCCRVNATSPTTGSYAQLHCQDPQYGGVRPLPRIILCVAVCLVYIGCARDGQADPASVRQSPRTHAGVPLRLVAPASASARHPRGRAGTPLRVGHCCHAAPLHRRRRAQAAAAGPKAADTAHARRRQVLPQEGASRRDL